MDISFTQATSECLAADQGIVPPFKAILESVYHELERTRLPKTLPSGTTILQGCLPLLMEESSAHAIVARIGQEKYQHLKNLYKQSSLLNLWYGLEMQQILEAFIAAHIPVMVLKGADIASTFYPRVELRHYGDIDLLVQPEHLAETIALFERAGYHYHQEYRFEAISKQRAGFVYVKEVAVGYLVFEIHTSPHSNEMGVSFDAARMWERARPITIAGVSVLGMGLEDLLLYLCWHYRSHAFNKLIWLYDIAVVLSGVAEQIDWELLARLARKQGLLSTVYYCVRWCQQIFRLSLPPAALTGSFIPPAFIQTLIARFVGDDTATVLRRNALRERKLLQRLMVDDVSALCMVLLRVIVPSPTHLGRLYMEQYPLPVHLFWLYYPLHPFFVLRAYFQKRTRQKRRELP